MKNKLIHSTIFLQLGAFFVLGLLSISGSFIITKINAWELVIGLMDLSVLGSYSDFLLWFPNWGHVLFSLTLILKIIFLGFIIKRGVKEYFKWKSIEILSEEVELKKDIVKGIYLTILLLILYCFGWFLLVKLNVGDTKSLELRIVFSRGFLFQIVFQFMLYISKHKAEIKTFLYNYLFEPTSPYTLSFLRILFFSYLIFIYSAKLSTVLPIVDLEHRESLPFIGWLVHILPINADIYSLFAYVGIVSSILIIIGWRTKTFMIINAITIFYVMATPNFFGKLWHEQIVIWLSWIMALSQCSNVLSIDALLKGKNTEQSGDNTWPIRLIWLHFGLIYFWAGFYKIWDAGFDWALSDSMINQVQLEWLQHFDKVPLIRIDHYPIILHLGGLLVILFELLFPFFILVKNWRWIAFFGGLIMHNLLGYFLYISFLHFLQVFYVFFVDINWIVKNKVKQVNLKHKANSKLKIGILILVLNLFAGMFNINSYPFSAYPKYSALIPGKILFIRFNANDGGIDTFGEAKKSGFRWEDYGWLEYELINNFNDGKRIDKEVSDYWEIWKTKIKNLQNCKKVVVELCERPVQPEGKYKIVVLDTIATLNE